MRMAQAALIKVEIEGKECRLAQLMEQGDDVGVLQPDPPQVMADKLSRDMPAT